MSGRATRFASYSELAAVPLLGHLQRVAQTDIEIGPVWSVGADDRHILSICLFRVEVSPTARHMFAHLSRNNVGRSQVRVPGLIEGEKIGEC